jgi:RNA 2',3'-cyclic 3'-phosphodiesterase
MRLFIALDIDEVIRQRIAVFMDGVRGFAPDARWVKPESLHVTLKFIGEKPDDTVAQIKQALAGLAEKPFEVSFRGHGFFPTPKSPRVFWVGIAAGPELARLAAAVDADMFTLGIPHETHPFSPHLTLARGGKSGATRGQKGDAPNENFHRLAQKLASVPAPDFGSMTAREFFLYRSQLSRGGSQYTKIERFGLQ